jgi:HPr Serine kinase C-terminal domain
MGNEISAHCFNIHGLTLAVNASAGIWELLDSRLGAFPPSQSNPPDFAFEFGEMGQFPIEPPQGHTRPIYESGLGEVLYAPEQDVLYVNYHDRVQARCELLSGRARVAFQATTENLWIATHHLFTILLIECLKRRGLYSLHAAGMCVNGKGLFLPGSSGAGKSTLALALVRAGYGLLADDMVFLQSDAEGLCALAFPEEIDVTEETARLFPELHFLLNESAQGKRKMQVNLKKVYGATAVSRCQPAVLVFPRVGDCATSVCIPMDRGAVLLELVPDVLLTEPHASQMHLDILASLVKQCECYRLETGRDFDVLPGILAELVERSGVS